MADSQNWQQQPYKKNTTICTFQNQYILDSFDRFVDRTLAASFGFLKSKVGKINIFCNPASGSDLALGILDQPTIGS